MAHKGGDGEAVLLKHADKEEDNDDVPAQALHVSGATRVAIFTAAVLTEMISWSLIM